MLGRLKFDLNELANEILDKLPPEVFDSEVTTFCDPCMGGGQFVKAIEDRLKKHGHSDYNISKRVFGFGSIVDVKYYKAFGKGVSEPKVLNILEEEVDMKFDVVLGNPPYGKNSNLAIAFLNKSKELSDTVVFVVPRTLKKKSSMRRIDKNLHLENSFDAPDDAFSIGVTTVVQFWNVKDEERVDVYEEYTTEDFEFCKKEEADIALGRVGAGPCSKVFTEFENRSPNSHYFLKVKNSEVTKKLNDLYTLFRKSASETAGNPSLSKYDLVKIYVEQNS